MNLLAVVTFIFFTALVAVISWYLTKNENLDSSSGYFLGGRSLSGVVIAGSLLLTNLSTEQLVGMNGNAFMGGLSVIGYEVTSGITLIFMGLYFLPRYLTSGFTTVPQFLEERYDKGTRNIVAILFLISLGIIFLPVVLYSGGVALNSLFNVSAMFGISEQAALVLTIWGIGIIGGIYAIFGGLKAVAVSDTINGIGLIAGGILIPVLGLKALGDGNFTQGIEKLIINHPEKLNAIGDATAPVPFSTLFTGIILINTFYWCTNQAIVQRAFGAKSLAEGQKGVIYAGFLKIFAPIILAIPGIIAFHLYGNEITKGDFAYPILVNKVLPTPLVGFFGAVLFGAILSSFNSALNSASTLFCLDLYKPMVNPNIEDKKLVTVGKIFGTVLGILAILVAPYIVNAPNGLFEFMKKFMGFFNVPTLVIVFVGFFSRKIPAIAAKVAIFVFMFLYGMMQFVYKVNISFLHVLGMLFVLCVIIMVIIGYIAPMKTPYVQSIKNEISLTHWRYAKPMSALIVTTTIYVYTLLSHSGLVGFTENIGNRFMIITAVYIVLSAVLFVLVDKMGMAKTKETVKQTV